MTKITFPNKGFNGVGAGGLEFKDGVAHTDDEPLLNYFASTGYSDAPAEADAVPAGV